MLPSAPNMNFSWIKVADCISSRNLSSQFSCVSKHGISSFPGNHPVFPSFEGTSAGWKLWHFFPFYVKNSFLSRFLNGDSEFSLNQNRWFHEDQKFLRFQKNYDSPEFFNSLLALNHRWILTIAEKMIRYVNLSG